MKNLKKVLSLALVFAMVLGLCIGAMAANTQDVTTLSDWGNVTHKEAAQLLNAFNIMQGYTDKTFRPTNTVTRAEAVKMIDVGLWGGVDQPDRFIGSEKTFSDVKNSDWFAGHVTYAQALGILDGFPDGTFRPNDTVTGYQMLKMALIALNYNSEVEGLTGAGWDIRTMRLATDPSAGTAYNLTAGLSEITDWNAPLTRDQAAQIIYNMIMHAYVTYKLTANGQVGNVKDYTNGSFGTVYLGLKTEPGVLVANQYGSVTKGYAADDLRNTYPVQVDKITDSNCIIADEDVENVLIAPVDIETTTNGTTATAAGLIKATLTSTIEDLGTPVTIYYKDKAPIAVSIDSKTEVEPTVNPVTGVLTNADREKGTDKTPEALSVTYGYEKTGTPAKEVVAAGAYEETTAYDVDGDGRVDFTTIKAYSKPTEVKAVTTTNKHGDVYQVNSIAWRSSYEDSDLNSTRFLAADDASFTAAKGDIIAYNTLVNAYGEVASYGIVLDAVAGKIDRVNETNPQAKYINIDGVQYYLAKDIDTPTFGVEGTAYTYPDGKIGLWVNKTTAPDATKYAVIYDAGWYENGANPSIAGSTITVEVAAILDTGETGVYKVASVTVPNDSPYIDAKDHYEKDEDDFEEADTVTIPVSAFNRTSILAANTATITITNANGGDATAHVAGLFYNETDTDKDGILTNIDNSDIPDTNKPAQTSTKDYALVTYTVNDDGSLNITVMPKTGDGVKTIEAKTVITANSPSLGTQTYFKSSTLTFTQTEQKYVNNTAKTGDVTKETWTVVTGLPTTTYTINDGMSAEAYTNKYFSNTQTSDNGAVAFVLTADDVQSAPSTLPFLYVVNNNGRSGTFNNAPVYLLDVYNAETDKIEQIETTYNALANSFWTGYNATTKALGTEIKMSLANNGDSATAPYVGFITSIADNVIGIEKVNHYEDKNPEDGTYDKRITETKAFVVDKDTKYYIIDGDESAQTDLSGIGTQEILDWADRMDGTTKVELGTHFYQAAVIATGTNKSVATYVIVFAAEQGQKYQASTTGAAAQPAR